MARKEDSLDLYWVDKKFIRDLSKVDDNVMSVSPQTGKNTRPFIGIVLIMDEKEYCIPLTSPKDKFNGKSKEDYIKIPDPKLKNSQGAPITIGILNLNNMIPVTNEVLTKIDLSSTSQIDRSRKELLKKEIKWCRDNLSVINNRANKIYKKVTETPEKSHALARRCCNFKKLEEVLQRFTENAAAKSSNQKSEKLIKEVTNEEYSALSKNGIKFSVQKKNGKTAILFDKSLKDKVNQVIENVHKKVNKRK